MGGRTLSLMVIYFNILGIDRGDSGFLTWCYRAYQKLDHQTAGRLFHRPIVPSTNYIEDCNFSLRSH